MTISRALRFTPRQQRTFVSTLFALTFVASIITVSASNILPCPAHDRGRFADGVVHEGVKGRVITVVEKRPRRWIEETPPAKQS